MSTFLGKLRTVLVGQAHDLLDKAIDMNSPSAVRQYVRDLEDALDKMRSEAAIQAGQVRTLDREIGDLQHQIESGTATIVRLQGAGNVEGARAKAALVVGWKNSLAEKQKQLEAQKTTSTSLDVAVSKIDAKHAQMVQQVRELERLDRDSKAKEQAASALSAAGKLVAGGADISMDDVAGRMRARNDVAEEKFQRAMGGIDVPEDAETSAAVDDLLNSLKK